ncbi:alpha/beta hydrolase [Primorskyibacter sp. 2E107]|uniref:alpha/beta hydrolase n=1 Tax=Primorskyibacter sp. 2E107 TaxID=3403458 RepID=UPI003AF62F4C
MFAEGVEDAMRRNQGFASPKEAAAFWAEGAAAVPTVDLTVPGGAGQTQAARLYRGAEHAPVLLFMHGGGWTGGSIDLNERACAALAAEGGWSVLSVSYRLAPEHPFPAGLSDCCAALRWLRGGGLGFQPERVALGGASAGGNLALACALSEGGPLAVLLLFYPVCGDDFDTQSYYEYAEGFGLTRARMQELFSLYDPEEMYRNDPRLVPLKGDLRGMPRCEIIAAELDVLADDSRRLASRLTEAGVPNTLHIEPGVTHGFINRGRLIPAADICLSRAAKALRHIIEPEMT